MGFAECQETTVGGKLGPGNIALAVGLVIGLAANVAIAA